MKPLLLFLLFVSLHLQAVQVIMLMGPSCAGKSTLSKQLCTELNVKNENWRVIDFDDVEESIELLITTTNYYLLQDINVIIDTNTYKDEMEKEFNGAPTIIKIIVTAPLEVLLQRDARRTQRLNRTEQMAVRCRDFVINSFNRSLTWLADLIIDSSQHSAEESCVIIFNYFK
jgi:adenylylsulfate kinase-like enzyme